MSCLRSRAGRRGQGPSSNARLAAFTARSTSSAVPTAKLATSSLVAGFRWVQLPPSEAPDQVPSMYSCPPLTPSSSRFDRTLMAMASPPLHRFEQIHVVPARDQVDAASHPFVLLHRAERFGVVDARVAAAAVGEVADGQAPLGRAVAAVGHGVGGNRGRAAGQL